MKKKENHISLLQDLLNNQDLNSSDLKMLFKLYNSEKENAEIKNLLEKKWSKHHDSTLIQIDSSKILSNINASIYKNRHISDSKLKVFYQWSTAVAATLLVALLVSAVFFFDVRWENNDVFVLNEISASNGKMKNFELPDGTQVWLNPGSSMVYSENMTKEKIRDVRLLGQAFFEVAKDARHPFVLQLGDIGLKVIGTSFNATNYKDDPNVEVVLQTGQVNLFEGSYADATNFTKLTPGQLASYQKGNKGFKIKEVDVQKYTSWMGGVLMFRDDLMSDVFRCLERWYDVKIIVNDPKINNYLYTATIKNESLEQILKLLEYTSKVSYEIIKSNDNQNHSCMILIKNKNSLKKQIP